MTLLLGDYADGGWYFIALCEACDRETTFEPAELLAGPDTGKVHCGMRVEDLASLLRCRECRSRRARLEPVARTRRQGFIGGTI